MGDNSLLATIDPNRTSVSPEDVNTQEMGKLLPPILYLVVLMILGIPGNIFALIIYRQWYSRSVYRTIIRSLAMVDFLFCFLTLPFNIGRLVRYYTFYNLPVCKIFTTLIIFFILFSSHLLIILAIYRYRQVCHPHKKQITNHNVRYWIVGGFMLAVFLDIPEAFTQIIDPVDLKKYNTTGYVCPVTFKSVVYTEIYNWFLTTVYAIYTIILFVLYILIGRRMYIQRIMRQQSIQSPGQTANDDLHSKINKIAVTVSVAFALSYLPLFVLKGITSIGSRNEESRNEEDYNKHEFAALKIFERFYSVNHVANPFIYTYFDNRFREQLKVLLSSLFCRVRRQSAESESRADV